MNIALPATGYRFGYVEYPPGGVFGPREQTGLQFVYFYTGGCVCTVDDAAHEVPERHGIMLFPGHRETFAFSARTPTHHGWVDREISPAAVAGYAGCRPVIAPVSEELLAIAHGGFLAGRQTIDAAEEARDATARLLIQAFLVRSAVDFRPAELPRQLARVLAYIDDHWHTRLDLSDLADVGAVSGTHLNRLFRRHKGITAMKYLRRYRAERAAQLIRNTSLTLERIAGDCGFANPFHLSRVIHQEFGVPPARLRHPDQEPR